MGDQAKEEGERAGSGLSLEKIYILFFFSFLSSIFYENHMSCISLYKGFSLATTSLISFPRFLFLSVNTLISAHCLLGKRRNTAFLRNSSDKQSNRRK